MQLTTCLTACDLAGDYLKCFPLFNKAWKRVVAIEPKLLLVADTIPEELRSFEADIILFPPVAGLHPTFQAQCARLLYPATLTSVKGAVIISDVDMIPMSASYYTATIRQCPDDCFVVYRSDALPPEDRQYPLCYNAACPSIWSELFGGIRDLGDVKSALIEWGRRWSYYDGKPGGAAWFADQMILLEYVTRYLNSGKRVFLKTDLETGFARLDRTLRAKFFKRLPRQIRSRISSGQFTDYHMLRPFRRNEGLNEWVADLAPGVVDPPKPTGVAARVAQIASFGKSWRA